MRKEDREQMKKGKSHYHSLPYLGDVLYELLSHILWEVLGPESKLKRCLLLDILALDLKSINSWINIYFVHKIQKPFKSIFF